jgi:hypothetical protein
MKTLLWSLLLLEVAAAAIPAGAYRVGMDNADGNRSRRTISAAGNPRHGQWGWRASKRLLSDWTNTRDCARADTWPNGFPWDTSSMRA